MISKVALSLNGVLSVKDVSKSDGTVHCTYICAYIYIYIFPFFLPIGLFNLKEVKI